MLSTIQNGYANETESYGEQTFSETPFADPRMLEQEEPIRGSYVPDMFVGIQEFHTPFLSAEANESGQSESYALEVSEFSEVLGELKDTLFRESLEQLADEAMEAHAEQLAGEYGDRETRDMTAERMLNEHFEPLSAQAEAMLDRFFERLEGYEAESLTDTEIERIGNEVPLAEMPMSPASEQFLGGLLRKAKGLVSGAVNLAKKGVAGAINLAGKGLAAVGKLALGPLLEPLKKLGKFLLKHVVRFALNQLPGQLRPLAQKLSDKLFSAIGETSESEVEAFEQSEAGALPAGPDAARLEAEFDVHAAQLLFTPDEAEVDHMVSGYGENENYSSPMSELDKTRSQLVQELSRLQPGENAQPLMEQFLPALWPVAKTAITIMGRGKVVDFIAKLLTKLIKPLIGADASGLLAPAIADAGLRIFGLETNYPTPRAMMAEALAATVEETVNAIAELPPHVLQDETLLTEAVQEAFENAAASYFPNSVIKPELRESGETHGMWTRMPARSERKRYAKYSHDVPVEIPHRVARNIDSFGSTTLHDHLRDHHGLQEGRPFRGKVTLYHALPGTTANDIARHGKFHVSQLHPLTPQAAGALLGPSSAQGMRPTPPAYMASPNRLHVNQRLYRIEPEHGRRLHHVRRVHSELLINLPRGEIRLWLYLSEPLCQRIAADLAKGDNGAAAFRHVKRLLMRTTEAVKMSSAHRHLPPHVVVVGPTPNLNGMAPHWLRHSGHHLGARIAEWAQAQLAQYFRNNAEDFKRACASHHDGVTLRITMTRIPGIEALRLLARGKEPAELEKAAWPAGTPTFQVVARSGYVIHRLRD